MTELETSTWHHCTVVPLAPAYTFCILSVLAPSVTSYESVAAPQRFLLTLKFFCFINPYGKRRSLLCPTIMNEEYSRGGTNIPSFFSPHIILSNIHWVEDRLSVCYGPGANEDPPVPAALSNFTGRGMRSAVGTASISRSRDIEVKLFY